MELILTIPHELQNAALQIRWCLDAELRQKLAELKVRNPFLLLTWKDGREEYRELVPLMDAAKYISFFRSGKHRLLAAIVWPKEGKTVGDLKKYFLSRGDYTWSNTAVDHWSDDGKENLHLITSAYYDHLEVGTAELELDIPKDVFAPEPPQWLQNWVYRYFHKPAKDECHFREKMIFAFTLQPIIWLFHMLGLMIFTLFVEFLQVVYTLVGTIVLLAVTPFTLINPLRLSLKPAIMPWKFNDLNDFVYKDNYSFKHSAWSIWWRRLKDWKYELQNRQLSAEEREERELRKKKLAETKALAVQRQQELEQKRLSQEMAKLKRNLENLACSNLTTPPTKFVRPVQKATLFFWGIKRHVCRPFRKQ